MKRLLPERGSLRITVLAAIAIVAGAALHFAGRPDAAGLLWLVALLFTSLPLLGRTLREAFAGDFATDAVAALAIITALILDQPLPGLIVVIMQSGGEALDRYAERRATRALHELEEGAPRVAHRLRDGRAEDVVVDEVRPGDLLLVRPGEVVPVDGHVIEGRSHMNTAQITGEPVPTVAVPGAQLFSGYWNIEGALTMRAEAVAAQSQYERIVQLVRNAQAANAPIQRLADRYAVWFTPLTIAVALLAWLLTGEPGRILAVLVVATPCPLILATPVALIGGMNSCARQSVIVRSGAVLERLTTIRAVVFDKTGTLTTGTPTVTRIVPLDGFTESQLLHYATSVEQASTHTLARAVVTRAAAGGVTAPLASNIVETAGSGLTGMVDGHPVAVGSREHVAQSLAAGEQFPLGVGAMQRAWVAVDGRVAGFMEFDDLPRADLELLMRELRARGMERLVILSGDDTATVRRLSDPLGFDEAHGDLKPDHKLDHVRRLSSTVGPTLMLGDGTNDAPALAAAEVGVAITPRGGGIAAETADVILLGDDLRRLVGTLDIARRTLRIARQSIVVGLGLSACGMVLAAFGYLPPVAGAIFQEVIDVGVIGNALRAAIPREPPAREPHSS